MVIDMENLKERASILKNLINNYEPKDLKSIAESEADTFNSSVGHETDCKICKGKGYIMAVEVEHGRYYTYVKECRCMRDKIAKQEAKNSGTEQLLEYQFSNFYTKSEWQNNLKELAMENAKSKDWFFVGGQSGAGKTHICSAIANYQRKHGVRVKHIVWTDEIDKLKDFESTVHMDNLKMVECLYIDDMFKKVAVKDKQGLTPADITKTWELLNFRANNKLKTIISTECTFDDLVGIDESLAGRIKQKAGKYTLSLSRDIDKNMRLK